MRISGVHFRYSRSMRTSKGGVSWLYNWVTAFRAPREQGYELLNEVTQFPLIMTTATRLPDVYVRDEKTVVYNKEEDYVRMYRNLVACFETAKENKFPMVVISEVGSQPGFDNPPFSVAHAIYMAASQYREHFERVVVAVKKCPDPATDRYDLFEQFDKILNQHLVDDQ